MMAVRQVIGVYDNGLEKVLATLPEDTTSDDAAQNMLAVRGQFPAWLRLQRVEVDDDGNVRAYLHVVLSRAVFSGRFWWEVGKNVAGRIRGWWKGDRP